MLYLKADTSVTVKIGPFLDDTDGKTAETGLTIGQADIRLSKNGGDIAQTNDVTGATHDELGVYNVPLDATDTNTEGRLQLWVHESGALPVFHEFMVVNANVYDSLFAAAATDYLDVQVKAIDSGAITATAIDGDAITSAKIADDALANEHFAAGALTSTEITSADGCAVASIAENAITATAINADAITEAKIADNAIAAEHIAAAAIDNATFAADVGSTAYATNIIALAVRKALDELNLDHLLKVAVSDRDTLPEIVDDTILANILTKTDGDVSDFDHSTDSLEALRDHIGDGTNLTEAGGTGNHLTEIAVNSIANNAITAAAIAEDAGTEIATAVWSKTESQTGNTHTFEVVLTRLFRFFFNDMNITDATGAVALRNEANDGDIATQSITDDDTTTTRTDLVWS